MFRHCLVLFLIASVLPVLVSANDLVAETAAVHAHDKPIVTAAASTPPASDVESGPVAYGDGMNGFLAKPATGAENAPGLIVIHEWWGLNDNIRGVTERLAGEGYIALAVDLYNGESAGNPKQAMKLMQALSSDQEAAHANLRKAFAYLEKQTGGARIGSIGWCLGGRWSLNTALLLPEQLDAAVIYYGSLTTDPEQLATLQMPILGNFAENDPLIPLDQVAEFESNLKSLGKDVDVKVYEGAQHAFSNPSGTAYNAAAAEDAWRRSTEFLARNLQQ